MAFFTPETFDVDELFRKAKKAEEEFAKLDQNAVVRQSVAWRHTNPTSFIVQCSVILRSHPIYVLPKHLYL